MPIESLLAPLILLPLMFVVGLQLTPSDFRRVLAEPRAVVGGTLAQLLLLPLMTWALISGMALPPAVAVGALLLAATPGAGLSNVMAAVSGANVALSVTLTAFASVLSVITLPALAALGVSVFFSDGLEIEVPISHIIGQLATFLALPIAAGMWVRSRREAFAIRTVPRANRVAVVAALMLTALGAMNGGSAMPTGADVALASVGAFAWTLAAMGIGWGLGSLLRLDAADRFTFLIEFSARNLALTVVVAVGSMGRIDLAVFPGTYGLVGFPLVIIASVLRGRLKNRG